MAVNAARHRGTVGGQVIAGLGSTGKRAALFRQGIWSLQELRSIPTLNQLVRDRYLPHAQASKRSWNTDEIILRIHILPALGRLPLDQITGKRIAGLINKMRTKGYAGATTNRVLVLLRYVFNLARKWNVPGANVNPTEGLTTAPEVHRQRFLTPQETQRLIASI